jgi:hypothetical protein
MMPVYEVVERELPKSGGERVVMASGEVFWVDRHGWIFDDDGRAVEHPRIDRVREAIFAFDRL